MSSFTNVLLPAPVWPTSATVCKLLFFDHSSAFTQFGELPLTLSYVLPELTACARLAERGRAGLSQGLADLLDGEGLIQARHLHHFRALAACWKRCRAMGVHIEGGGWAAEAEEQFQWVIRQTLRLARRDGSQVFSTGEDSSSPALLQALVGCATDSGTLAVGRHLLDRGHTAARVDKILGGNFARLFRETWART